MVLKGGFGGGRVRKGVIQEGKGGNGGGRRVGKGRNTADRKRGERGGWGGGRGVGFHWVICPHSVKKKNNLRKGGG